MRNDNAILKGLQDALGMIPVAGPLITFLTRLLEKGGEYATIQDIKKYRKLVVDSILATFPQGDIDDICQLKERGRNTFLDEPAKECPRSKPIRIEYCRKSRAKTRKKSEKKT